MFDHIFKLKSFSAGSKIPNIFTSLDLGSHIKANQALKGRMGAVVAVEIDSGAIVTLFSSPSYSINDLSNGISNNQFNALIQDPKKPFFNRFYSTRPYYLGGTSSEMKKVLLSNTMDNILP